MRLHCCAQDVRFVATEKGFPSPTNLLAPYPNKLVYAIVVREPTRRFVSYYFWKWRRKDLFAVATKKLGGSSDVAEVSADAPSFKQFVEREQPLDAYYVRRLLGMAERSGTVDEKALDRAKAVLSRTFSLILLTERLGDFGPLVQRTLGWTASDFDAFRAKKNPAPDTRLLEAWRPDNVMPERRSIFAFCQRGEVHCPRHGLPMLLQQAHAAGCALRTET